ncbi:TonB family protein [Pelagicoccus sp. SDUM812003]|uniref:TonB family protein n=1 Tax=Pelagicoccus sp. SDUM812003 TaxID=3041267 RepID=UPI00280E7D2B|nr:TonB family protein [Pelagicoccus sp. SDUM812003]MDQ8203281.1 TonB family protein [Pelagicoccus sp. SDUM812003]
MEEIRLANMFYEQRGPLVFSASAHLVAVIVFAILGLVSPEKDPEELVFELVSPPSGGYAQETPLTPIDPIQYRSEQIDLPTEDEIVLPERPLVPVEIPEPVVERRPVVEQPKPVETKPVETPRMSLEDFRRMHGDEVKNVRAKPSPTSAPRIDLSKDLQQLQKSLNDLGLKSIPGVDVSSMSVSDQQTVANYLARLRAALKRMVERHPIPGTPLRAVVSCDISGGGHISDVKLVRGSGDPVYDRKVMESFRKLRIFDAPPDNVGYSDVPFTFVQE